MILQTLDIKDDCKGIFHEGTFLFENTTQLAKQYSIAWKHSPMLNDEMYQYLYLLVKDDDISSFCHDPELFLNLLINLKGLKSNVMLTFEIE